MKKIFYLLVFTCFCASANVRLPLLLGDNMVLQRNKPVKIWGWADANENVTVTFKSQVLKTKADKAGKWLVTLSPEVAGGPFQMTVKGNNSITLNNILIGEVWICSGQSNMEWPLRAANNAEQEIKDANYPDIRHFTVQKAVASHPQEDIKGGDWKACTPANAGDFTAVGYFFARELCQKLKVPIGLVHTSWGGTHSETWTSREAFQNSEEFKTTIGALPILDLDAYAKQRSEALVKRLAALNITLPAKDVASWKDFSYDDSKWNTMKIPGLWEQQNLDNLDGVIWFRKSFAIRKEDAGKEATIEVSKVDDSDQTFINGIKVGETINKYNEKRKYKIPVGVLKEGANVVVVRVEDTGGGGGIFGEPNDLKVTTASNNAISLAGQWTYNIENLSGGNSSIGPNSYPSLLFNAMLYPLVNFAIEGVIWYQGESNAGRSYQYRTAFPLMITDWRNHWHQGDFPFYFVQLASFNAGNGDSERGSGWAELREAQTMTLSLPNTGMAVTTDIGEANDIHPRNKQDVGKRLAAVALSKVYAQHNVGNGPLYKSMTIEGNKIKVSFTDLGTGLWVKDKYGYLKGFELAGADQKFRYAKAWIEGNEVIVSCDQVPAPLAVRFAWADNPEDANLYNKEGFPASPFRSDNWKSVTLDSKFQVE